MATLGAQQFGTNIPPPYAESQRIFYLLLRAGATLQGTIRVARPKLLSLLAEYDVAGAPPRGLKRAKAIVEKCGDWFTPENLMAKGSAAGGLCR